MNRRMIRAKAARKFHAARRRWWQRNPPVVTITITLCGIDALRDALYGVQQAADDAADAMRYFGQAVRDAGVIDGECRRLEPGQLFARLPGGELQHVGQTGPLLLERPRPAFCGVCGQVIRSDPWTGTTCACAARERAFLAAVPDGPPRPSTWSPLLCECTGTGPTCGYCRGHGVP